MAVLTPSAKNAFDTSKGPPLALGPPSQITAAGSWQQSDPLRANGLAAFRRQQPPPDFLPVQTME